MFPLANSSSYAVLNIKIYIYSIVRVLYNWFSGLSCSVVWNSLIGTPFCVYCGVRQGGVLSPLLFAIYSVSQKSIPPKTFLQYFHLY